MIAAGRKLARLRWLWPPLKRIIHAILMQARWALAGVCHSWRAAVTPLILRDIQEDPDAVCKAAAKAAAAAAAASAARATVAPQHSNLNPLEALAASLQQQRQRACPSSGAPAQQHHVFTHPATLLMTQVGRVG
jgi:hypothetical protein